MSETPMPPPRVTRRSPIRFDAAPARVELRDGWEVVLAYESEPDTTSGVALVDLSHRRRWDLQDRRIDELRPFGLPVPTTPGAVATSGGRMINRMNRTQASIWHVGPGPAPATPDSVGCTDTTDAHGWVALIGARVPALLETVTALDLFPPDRATPFLTQGPILHVPCQIVTVAPDVVLSTFSRGYGQTFVDALLHDAGSRLLRPAGEHVFTERFSDGFS